MPGIRPADANAYEMLVSAVKDRKEGGRRTIGKVNIPGESSARDARLEGQTRTCPHDSVAQVTYATPHRSMPIQFLHLCASMTQ